MNKDLIFWLKLLTSPIWVPILGIAWLIYFRHKLKEKDRVIKEKDKVIEEKTLTIKNKEYWVSQKVQEEVPEILVTQNRTLIKKGNLVELLETKSIKGDLEEILAGRGSLDAWYNQ